jgi:hypothetical protein
MNERIKSGERTVDKARKCLKRKDPEFKDRECRSRKQRKHGSCLDECIKLFHSNIATGPIYVCSSCHQTWFKHSVIKASTLRKNNTELLEQCLTGFKSVDNAEWICTTCRLSIKSGMIPKLSVANGMQFPVKSPKLDLNELEERLISLRIPFMQLYELKPGDQLSIRGSVVNVPVDVESTVNALPRPINDSATIPVKLKRKVSYSSTPLNFEKNVRPVHILRGLNWLMKNSELYKNSGVRIDDEWLRHINESLCVQNDDTDIGDRDEHHETGEHDNESQNADTIPGNEPYNSPTQEGTNNKVEQEVLDGNEADVDDEADLNGISSKQDTLIDEPEINSDHAMVFAPGEGQRPLGMYHDPDMEYLCFPSIFCGQRRINNSARKRPVSDADIYKWELRSEDGRCRTCKPNLFLKMKRLQIKQLNDKVSLSMRRCKKKGQKYTAGHVLNHADNIVYLNEGYYIFRSIRNSPPYLERRKKDVFAMIRQLGLPTWFMSLSAADLRWTDLLIILGKLLDHKGYTIEEVNDMDWNKKTDLIKSDPVTCARYFDHRVHEFINLVLKSQHNPLGHIKDSFYRVEFQNRGSPHIHMLLWVDDAPVYEKDSDEEVIEYIQKHLSCSGNIENEEENELVKLQRHKCSKRTCKNNKKESCRFGFPMPPMRSTKILTPLEGDDIDVYKKKYDDIKKQILLQEKEKISYEDFLETVLEMSEEDYIKAIRASLQGPKVFLKREMSEQNINPYMKFLFTAWKANHDLQFVLDPYACAMYIVGYISKSQKGMSYLMDKACKEARQGSNDLKKQVRYIGNQFLHAVEVSAQEAAYLTLQLPLTRCSREVLFVHSSPPDERTFFLKSKEALEKLAPQSTDIESNNVIKRYASRPKQLKNWCLADYASKIDIKFPTEKLKNEYADYVDNVDDDDDEGKHSDDEENMVNNEENNINSRIKITLQNGITLTERKTARVLRYVRYRKSLDQENHYRELLMLFLPWRNEEKDLLGDFDTYTEHYENRKHDIDQKRQEYEHNASTIDDARERAEIDDRTLFGDVAPNTEQTESEDAENDAVPSNQFMFFNPDRPQEQRIYDLAVDIGLAPTTENEDIELIGQRIPDSDYKELVRSLNRKQYEFFCHVMKWIKTKTEPLHAFLSGGAGVGKSVVVKALYQALHRHLCSTEGQNPEDCRIIVCAPTGKAAFNVEGSTTHTAFGIDPNKGFHYRRPTCDKLNTLRTKYRHLEVVMIDEISMIGKQQFNFINLRLQDIKGKTGKLFGDVHMIAIGDLCQLAPVFDGWIFKDLDHDYTALAPNLWKELFSMHELTEVMRQRDDQTFAEILNRLREGLHTEEDLAELKTRIVDAKDSPPFAPHLFSVNHLIKTFNDKVFDESPGEKVKIPAYDVVLGDVSSDVKKQILHKLPTNPSQTGNFLSQLNAGVGLYYEITANLNVEDGIVNGSGCIIKKLQYITDSPIPSIIWVEFDRTKIGKLTRNKFSRFFTSNICRTWTPIFAEKRTFYVGKNHTAVTRCQFPMRQAAAKTIHKAQGDTLQEVVVNMSSWAPRHGHYVAFSRVTQLSGLYITDINEKGICLDRQVVAEMERLRTDGKLDLCYTPVYNLSESMLKVVFLNTSSLHCHFPDLASDDNITSADIIGIAESRLTSNDSDAAYTLPSYQIIRNDQVPLSATVRPHHGLVVYVKNQLNIDYVHKHSSIEFECIITKVSNMTQSVLVVVIYKSPSCKQCVFMDRFHRLVSEIDRQEHLIIIGDFNFDISGDNNRNILEFMESKSNCVQIIVEPTTNHNSILDLIFTDCQNTTSGTLECWWSDHKAVVVGIPYSSLLQC